MKIDMDGREYPLKKEIINDDILFRLERLVEDTVLTVEALKIIRIKKDEEYGF